MTELELDFEPTGTPKQITRHPDKLVAKARTHKVLESFDAGVYHVISGGLTNNPGNHYRIHTFKDGGASCDCDWAKKHDPDGIQRGASICSHTLAVLMHIEASNHRKLIVKASQDNGNVDGVQIKTRKAHYKQSKMFHGNKYKKKGG